MQSLLIEKSMIKMRRDLWEELNIKRDIRKRKLGIRFIDFDIEAR